MRFLCNGFEGGRNSVEGWGLQVGMKFASSVAEQRESMDDTLRRDLVGSSKSRVDMKGL